MSDFQEYLLRWRGREMGPYSVEQINRKLDDHEIGMGHEIQSEGKWISLEEFFRAIKQSAQPSAQGIEVSASTARPVPPNSPTSASPVPAVRLARSPAAPS